MKMNNLGATCTPRPGSNQRSDAKQRVGAFRLALSALTLREANPPSLVFLIAAQGITAVSRCRSKPETSADGAKVGWRPKSIMPAVAAWSSMGPGPPVLGWNTT